jgi:predicted RNA-binding protein YlxR (DUF448 family)
LKTKTRTPKKEQRASVTSVETTTQRQERKSERSAPERTCVGCGLHDDASAMLRLVVADDEIAFDLAGGAFGRGAHVHARPDCLAKAPRGVARSFKRDPKVGPRELAERLVAACDRRMTGLLLAARRTGAVVWGADATLDAIRAGVPLAIVAVDAASVAQTAEVRGAVAEGHAIAWKTKDELGSLLGQPGGVAVCAIRHEGIAGELKGLRAAVGAAVTMMTREGGECSRRPEAR